MEFIYSMIEKIIGNSSRLKREIYERCYCNKRIEISRTIKCVCPYSDNCSIHRQNLQCMYRIQKMAEDDVKECEAYRFMSGEYWRDDDE